MILRRSLFQLCQSCGAWSETWLLPGTPGADCRTCGPLQLRGFHLNHFKFEGATGDGKSGICPGADGKKCFVQVPQGLQGKFSGALSQKPGFSHMRGENGTFAVPHAWTVSLRAAFLKCSAWQRDSCSKHRCIALCGGEPQASQRDDTTQEFRCWWSATSVSSCPRCGLPHTRGAARLRRQLPGLFSPGYHKLRG